MGKQKFKYQVVFAASGALGGEKEWQIFGPGGPYLYGDDSAGAHRDVQRMIEDDRALAEQQDY